MEAIPRLYETILRDHSRRHRQIALLSGPRQVGKTTACRRAAPDAAYFDWDNATHRRAILRGPDEVARVAGLDRLSGSPRHCIFDEIHKYGRWRTFVKGFFDMFEDRCRVIVTGSSRLDVYRRGGDSLMGRYFPYRMHPLTIGELLAPESPRALLRKPRAISDAQVRALWEHGGFPEPFLKRDPSFSTRWQDLRRQQLVREDIRDLTRIQELGQIDVLMTILAEWSSTPLVYSSLAAELSAPVNTIRRWMASLTGLHYGFLLRPWFRSVAKSLRKEPKWYLTDWSLVQDPGSRAENLIACHLLKAVQGWHDLGLGRFELHYLRDKEKREVDFLVVRDRAPWFLVEAKRSEQRLSPALAYFQEKIGARHAFQAVLELPYVEADCFARKDPCVVPARTLLSQLL